MLKIAPHIQIVDVHHAILRQNIRHGAVVLAQAVRYMPEAVHLAVVDPGVGSGRKANGGESSSGAVFVGPNNRLLVPAVQESGGIARAFERYHDASTLN